MEEDLDEGSDICCPHCGEIQDAFEVFTHNRGHDGTNCLACGEQVEDDEWIQD